MWRTLSQRLGQIGQQVGFGLDADRELEERLAWGDVGRMPPTGGWLAPVRRSCRWGRRRRGSSRDRGIVARPAGLALGVIAPGDNAAAVSCAQRGFLRTH